MAIDLNCDMGESFGPYQFGMDEQVMPLITSANVACGFHAGDPQVMRRTVALAGQHGVAVGAHVSFPDLAGFGRRELQADPAEVENDVTYQIGALWAFCKAAGVPLRHVKPHGALYNMAQRDEQLAGAVARAAAAVDPALLMFAQPGSALERAGVAVGLTVVPEAFADRAYSPDGRLLSRKQPGAVVSDLDEVTARALRLVCEGQVVATDGTVIPLRARTLCVHGDTPGALGLVRRIRQAFQAAGVAVAAPLPPGA